MQYKVFTLANGMTLACKTADGKTWEMPCQKCGGMLFGTIPEEATLQPGESEQSAIGRLIMGWKECNGDPNQVWCQSCREGKVIK